MKKLLAVVVTLLIIVSFMVVFSSCSNNEEKILKLGFDADYPPYGYLDTETNTYKGFDIEFAKAVCDEIGYKLELVPVNWDFKDTELESGNIDCIWSGFTIQDREDLYTWSVEYSNSSIVVLVDKNSTINSIADLVGKKVLVQQESSGQSVLDSEDNADLVASFAGGNYETIGDYLSAYNQLIAGSCDAVVIDVGVANTFISKGTCKILSEELSTETYGVGFRLDDKELCKTVSDAMVKLGKKAQELGEKYGIADSIILGK